MSRRRTVALFAATAAAAAGIAYATPASAGPAWAPFSSASVRPGMQLLTSGAQCTANFVYTDAAGAVFIGYAAHCAGTGAATETNGCDAGSLPLGTVVTNSAGRRIGTLAYSSWLAMQAAGETNADACDYNDLGLVKVDADQTVNPSLPSFGGPTGVRANGLAFGNTVYTYGNSSLRFGVTALSPKNGTSVGDAGGGWTHTIYTITPGIPGDSGSAVIDDTGRAVGILSTVAILPLPLSNNATDVDRAVAYARTHGVSTLKVENGTESFTR